LTLRRPALFRITGRCGRASFPIVPVADVQVHAASNTLFAATFGRSILRTTIGDE
jgi:hypothetical protein